MTICTRFAPSPTGFLHVGSARTALYAWLFAKKKQGKFILRIEDTDRERSTEEAIQVIFDSMEWLGLDYDGPYYQTKHFDRYREVIQMLLDKELAYRCYCTREELETLRVEQTERKEKPRYDGRCRHRKEKRSDQPFVVRFKNPTEGSVRFDDQIRGPIEIQNTELDDLIIARTDGTPTYNFTVVVDDWDMKITHVIRGEDHINNTPRQINIFKALDIEPPAYAHLPMILGSDGKKLSKRHGALSVMQYRDDGYLPHVLLNYLVRLGWAHGDQEIFSIDEMIEYFEVSDIHRAAAQFDIEKLQWLNQQYMKTLPSDEVAKHLKWQFDALNLDVYQGPPLTDIVAVYSERAKTLKEMAEKSRYFYEDVTDFDQKAIKKHIKPELKEAFQSVCEALSSLADWTKESIHQVITDVVERYELKFGKLAQPIRIAVTGGTMSPSLDDTLFLLGKEKTLHRLKKAMRKFNW